MEPKLYVLLIFVGIVLGLSYFGRERPRVKSTARRTGFKMLSGFSGAAKRGAADTIGSDS